MRCMCVLAVASAVLLGVAGCESTSSSETGVATVSIANDFNNPEMDRKPPWTICECSYRGVEFGTVQLGDTSDPQDVTPGLDYVLMVLAWDDPACSTQNCLPVASRYEEETVDGQERVIAINAPNHQGPCPPEGIQPVPEDLYERIRDQWPEYGFEPYDSRESNPQCLE